jgi:hypothetical protein
LAGAAGTFAAAGAAASEAVLARRAATVDDWADLLAESAATRAAAAALLASSADRAASDRIDAVSWLSRAFSCSTAVSRERNCSTSLCEAQPPTPIPAQTTTPASTWRTLFSMLLSYVYLFPRRTSLAQRLAGFPRPVKPKKRHGRQLSPQPGADNRERRSPARSRKCDRCSTKAF